MIGLALTSQGRMEISLRTNCDAPTLDAPVTHTPGIGDSPAEKIKGGSHPGQTPSRASSSQNITASSAFYPHLPGHGGNRGTS